MNFAFAGDRDIAVAVLRYLVQRREIPGALLVSGEDRATHADELIALLPEEVPVYRGTAFADAEAVAALEDLDLDLIVGVHFPYIVPPEVLRVPRTGVINLHPAYLPYNRGWHTPSWAILDGTPYGATLHFMDEGVDEGDIIHQLRRDPTPGDTADSLYAAVKELEYRVFTEAWPRLVDGTFERRPQPSGGSMHRKRDLLSPEIQRLDLEETVRAGDLLRRLRALTTNRVEEACYFEHGGRRYRVQVGIMEEQG